MEGKCKTITPRIISVSFPGDVNVLVSEQKQREELLKNSIVLQKSTVTVTLTHAEGAPPCID